TSLLPGYTPSNRGGVLVQQDDDNGGVVNTESGCEFSGVTGGADQYCEVSNDADPQPVLSTKESAFEGSSSQSDLDTGYRLTLHCDAAVIVDGSGYCGHKGKEGIQSESGDTLYWCKKFEGDAPDTFEAMVIPQYPANDCWVEEKVDSDFVEISNECQN